MVKASRKCSRLLSSRVNTDDQRERSEAIAAFAGSYGRCTERREAWALGDQSLLISGIPFVWFPAEEGGDTVSTPCCRKPIPHLMISPAAH